MLFCGEKAWYTETDNLELLILNWSYNAKCYCINKKHERYHINN